MFSSIARSSRAVSAFPVRNLMSGVVKFFNTEKGYGFISRDDGAGDVFVHFSAIKNTQGGFRDLQQGQNVTFDVSVDARNGKPRAENVEVAQSQSQGNFADEDF
jgi:CspA family cold shock protein